MKIFLIGVFCLLSISAFAADDAKKPDPKSICGKTVEECQEKINILNTQISKYIKSLGAYKELLAEANDRLVGAASK